MILKIWNWISDFGVSEQHPDENELIRAYNGMSLLSAFGTLLMTFWAFLIDFSPIYLAVTSSIASLYLLVIILNFFDQITWARYAISIGSPLWISTTYLLVGGYFCQGLAILASMAITYIAFQKKPKVKFALLVFHLLLFFSVSAYVNTFAPIFGIIDFPYDEIMVFIGGLGWTIILVYKFDIDRSKFVKSLKANNQELKSATEELERFTYIASHDLKSPLRTIISFIGLIERNIKNENYSTIQQNLNFVKTGAEQMNFLVQDILEFSQLRKNKKAERSTIDLNLVFEKAKFNLKEEIEEKAATIHCEQLPNFLANELEFLLLFQNFIQNGIKYNESPTPTIRIAATIHHQSLILSFEDNGIGIEEQYYEQIFQFFKRLHNSDQYQGTGLGLGVCKKIISSYDGEINIHSQLGKGTTFMISFPLTTPIEVPVELLEKVDAE